MSEIKDIASIPTAVDSSVGKVEADTRKIIKETNINSKTEIVKSQNSKGSKEETGDEGNVKMLRSAVDTLNESLKDTRTSIKMKYHDKINRVSIKIIDDETQEVIKEIPPEKNLEMIQKMLEQAGIIVDERG